ncbi:MAG: DUF1080 domain-containing protein [Planctomycetes bacterium]|nr:DUF1080 domain-containing protein [Planctomycetota bacterium]
MKNVYYFASLLIVVAAISSPLQATEDGWIHLKCDAAMESWQGENPKWTVGGEVVLDEKNSKYLIAKPGENVLVSLNHEPTELCNLSSKQLFSDHEVHVEFLVPNNSNAGVKLQGLYEIQIRDTHGKPNPAANDCGGIYPRAELRPRYHLIDKGVPPRTNAAKPAGQWQTLDIVFQAPRFDAKGQKTENARFMKVVLNGEVIHEDVELKWPTGHAWRTKPEVVEGPVFLQGDHGPVAYRNVRVRPLAQHEK